MEWIKTYEIVDHISNVCNGTWITDEIDWNPILSSINYKDGKNTKPLSYTVTRPNVDLDRLQS